MNAQHALMRETRRIREMVSVGKAKMNKKEICQALTYCMSHDWQAMKFNPFT